MCWLANGTVVMGKDGILYGFNTKKDKDWRPLVSLTEYGIKNITRLAVSPNGSKLSIVGELVSTALEPKLENIRNNFVQHTLYEVIRAFDLGVLQKGKDVIIVNKDRQIATAKAYAKLMAEQGYTLPVKRKDIKVLGKQALGLFLVGTDAMEASNYISEHDQKIANKLAYVMSGGDLSEPTLVTEQYLLDIEDVPDRLIVCVHHPSRDEDAGMA